jgi:hypothetical protein
MVSTKQGGPILLLTEVGDPGLLGAYGRALAQLGRDVVYWSLNASLDRAARLGRLGRRLNDTLTIDAWRARGNRELVVEARRVRPSVIVVAAAARVTAGALAQIHAAMPEARLALLWPDTLLNLAPHVLGALPVYDVVATYSRSSIDPLRMLGARRVEWLPFGADTVLFPSDVALGANDRERLSCDVGFIGNHRPEREEAVLALLDAGFSVKVWGADRWKRDAASPRRVHEYWQGRTIFGADVVRAVRCSRVSLNVIDDTNYPAANMRFFEIMACGGAQLVSACPEMTEWFPHRASVVYYDGSADMVQKARELLADEGLRRSVAADAHARAMSEHTYVHRSKALLAMLGSGSS